MTETMHHRLASILIGSLLLSFAGGLASEASAKGGATFAPVVSASSVQAGERFAVDVTLDPQGEKIDTARANVTFPPDLLRVEAVTLGTLLPRSSPGNSFDNAAGTISEGGFLLGSSVSSKGTFATITFLTLKEGAATISIAVSSKLIANGEEKGTGSYGAAVVEIQKEDDTASPSIELISLSHPSQDAWYESNAFVADWARPDMGTVTGWLTAFDQSPTTDPGEKLSAKILTKTVDKISDGTWYFHLKGVLTGATYTQTAHYRVQVDQTPPNPIAPTTPRIRYLEGESALLTFGTTDETSGIDRYEVAIGSGTYEPAESPLVLTDLEIGDAFVQVKAVDRAGNATFGKAAFRVYPKDTVLDAEDAAARDKENAEIASLTNSQPSQQPASYAKFVRNSLFATPPILLAGFLLLRKLKRRK